MIAGAACGGDVSALKISGYLLADEVKRVYRKRRCSFPRMNPIERNFVRAHNDAPQTAAYANMS
jgi:hypothetical protein